MNYNDNNNNNYDNNGYGNYNAPEHKESHFERIRKRVPNVRYADVHDGKRALARGIFLGVFFILIGVFTFMFSIYSARKDRDFLSHSVEVTGTVTDVGSHLSGGAKYRTRVYDVKYTYTYNGIDYTSKDSLSLFEASSMSLLSDDAVGKTVTVYLDTRNPGYTFITQRSGMPKYYLLLFAVPGIICIYIGIDRFKCCKNGTMAVYLFKNKTEYVKLKD